MSMSVFDPSFCRLLPFHLHLCSCFKAMLLVRIYLNRPQLCCNLYLLEKKDQEMATLYLLD